MSIDLHTHSIHSDGTLFPAEIIAEAHRLGLSAVALTDHNTVSGLPEFMAEAHRLGVTAVAGVELSTVCDGREVHLLGLFIPPDRYAEVESLTQSYHVLKDQSNRDLVERLNAAGYPIDYTEVERKNPQGNINRALIAKELLAQGLVASVADAFDRLLGEGKGFYVPPKRLDLFDAIPFLRSIGAVPVWAHPLQYFDEAAVRSILPRAIEAGLLGMEVQHSSYDGETVRRAAAMAAEFGLLPSGGSDFHGEVKPDVGLGVGKGNLDVPDGCYRRLLAAASKS